MSDRGAFAEDRWWRRHADVAEVLANVLAIAVAPLVLRWLLPAVQEPLRFYGFDRLLNDLIGTDQFTDIGWEVVSARGLVENGVSPYDPLPLLSPLIDMVAGDGNSHIHPPSSLVPLLPLAYLPYSWWLGFFVVASIGLLAGSMRLMCVPASIAYPLAVLIAITPLGSFGITSTYTALAFLLALAWRFRDRPWVAGASFAFLAASRGIAAILLVYPLVRRQWKTVVIAIAIGFALLGIASILEPNGIADFLDRGRQAIEHHLQRPDLFTVSALLDRHGYPGWIAYVGYAVVAAVALLQRQEPYWVVAWFTIVVSPIAWGQSVLMAVPLLALIWMSGRLGQVLVLVTAVLPLTALTMSAAGWNSGWVVMVATTSIAMLACPLQHVDSILQRRKPALE